MSHALARDHTCDAICLERKCTALRWAGASRPSIICAAGRGPEEGPVQGGAGAVRVAPEGAGAHQRDLWWGTAALPTHYPVHAISGPPAAAMRAHGVCRTNLCQLRRAEPPACSNLQAARARTATWRRGCCSWTTSARGSRRSCTTSSLRCRWGALRGEGVRGQQGRLGMVALVNC